MRLVGILLLLTKSWSFRVGRPQQGQGGVDNGGRVMLSRLHLSTSGSGGLELDVDLSSLLTSRLPTSVDDQVRQASESLKRATQDGVRRHCFRLLLPSNAKAGDLDDWPGGARQLMQSADPLVATILEGAVGTVSFQKTILDSSDGVVAVMAQAQNAKDDSCTVLLPSADTITSLQELEGQVGPSRNLIVVNPQWKRKSDFGGGLGVFGGDSRDTLATHAEQFVTTFSLTNLICEGETIRILRTHPGPWRVFVRKFNEEKSDLDWIETGRKDFLPSKPSDWEKRPENQQDGGRLFDYGYPSYSEIVDMLKSSPDYKPKNTAERAAAAFDFLKDSL